MFSFKNLNTACVWQLLYNFFLLTVLKLLEVINVYHNKAINSYKHLLFLISCINLTYFSNITIT